jgi:hypothetical protein
MTVLVLAPFRGYLLCHRIETVSRNNFLYCLALPTNAQSALRGKVALRQQGRMGGPALLTSTTWKCDTQPQPPQPPIRHAAALRGTFPISASRAGGKRYGVMVVGLCGIHMSPQPDGVCPNSSSVNHPAIAINASLPVFFAFHHRLKKTIRSAQLERSRPPGCRNWRPSTRD